MRVSREEEVSHGEREVDVCFVDGGFLCETSARKKISMSPSPTHRGQMS